MTINIENFAIPYVAQGVTGALDLAEMHPNTVIEFIRYGARRKLQDNINSAAKVCRDSQAEARKNGTVVPKDYDAPGEVAALVAHFKAGTLPVKGAGVSSLESEIFRMANVAFKVTEGKDAHKALGEKIPAEFRIVLTAYIGGDMADYETRAQDSLDRKAVEAQTRAAEMASLLDKRDSVDFDLAKYGLTR